MSLSNKESKAGLSLRSRSAVSSIRQFCNDHKGEIERKSSDSTVVTVRVHLRQYIVGICKY